MCADFTISQIGGPSGSPIPVTSGVQEPSTVGNVASMLSGVIGSFASANDSGGFTAMQQRDIAKEEKFSVAGGRFGYQQLQIADAVAKGDLSSQEGRMRMRANYASAVADNGDIIDELTGLHKSIVSTSGLGAVVEEGTAIEQAFMKEMQGAMATKWVTPDMSAAEAREQTLNYMEFNQSQQMIVASQNELALKRAKLGYKKDKVEYNTSLISNEKAELELAEKKFQKKARDGLSSMAVSYFPKFRTDVNQVLDRVESGAMTDIEGVTEIKRIWGTIQQSVAVQGGGAASSHVQNLLSPMKFVYENAIEVANGNMEKTIYENRYNNAVAKQTAMMSEDPEVVKHIATAELLSNSPAAQAKAFNAITAKQISKNGQDDGPPANLMDPDEQAESRLTLDVVRSSLTAYNSGNLIGGEQAEIQLKNNVNNILKGLNAYESAVESPAQYRHILSAIASPEFGEYVTTSGIGFDKQAASAAKSMMDRQYAEVILPLIDKEWREAQTRVSAIGTSQVLGTVAVTEDTPDVLQPTWSGTGISFVSTVDNPVVSAQAKTLNKRVAPIINKYIRMGAHLLQTMDYKSVYEENYAGLFGTSDGEQEGDAN